MRFLLLEVWGTVAMSLVINDRFFSPLSPPPQGHTQGSAALGSAAPTWGTLASSAPRPGWCGHHPPTFAAWLGVKSRLPIRSPRRAQSYLWPQALELHLPRRPLLGLCPMCHSGWRHIRAQTTQGVPHTRVPQPRGQRHTKVTASSREPSHPPPPAPPSPGSQLQGAAAGSRDTRYVCLCERLHLTPRPPSSGLSLLVPEERVLLGSDSDTERIRAGGRVDKPLQPRPSGRLCQPFEEPPLGLRGKKANLTVTGKKRGGRPIRIASRRVCKGHGRRHT